MSNKYYNNVQLPDLPTFDGTPSAANLPSAISECVEISSTNYKASGYSVFQTEPITKVAANSVISWAENKPAGTQAVVSVSLDGINYSPVENGGAFVPVGTELSNERVYIKVELSTSTPSTTPIVSNINAIIGCVDDAKILILEMEPLERFESAAGNITVAYSGGTLAGEGGAVEPFEISFLPQDLAYKGDQNDQEHIEVSALPHATLTRIYYSNSFSEHGALSVNGMTANVQLTRVENI